ncbi:hypothetical protein OSTOST_06691, partial [Ostertagia ostertagi]
MSRRVDWWIRQVYLGIIPSYPVGYMIVHGFRDRPWSKIYVERSAFPPSEQLKELVESEMDKLYDLKIPKVYVSLTDSSEPRVYGGFFLNGGAELQFPMRVSFEDVESARRLAQNVELDLGLARHRRKIEVNTKIGEELTSRMVLSDAAKMFIVQRQLQLANRYFEFRWSSRRFSYRMVISACTFRQFLKSYNEYKVKWADEKAVEMGEDYLQGARDYFGSTMKFNRFLRVLLGEDGEQNISKNGDVRVDPVPLSVRLKNVVAHRKSMAEAPKENDSSDTLVMRLSRAVLSYRKWNEQATAFLQTKAGRRLRIGLLGGTIIAYPLASLLINDTSVEELPPRLKELAREEYERFLESESRVPKDAVVSQHLGKLISEYETVAAGSLGVRTGLHLAVPCHAQFENVDEALAYLRKHHTHYIDALGVQVPIQWDTPAGKELANAFVLSENALRFIFLRDLHAHDGYASLAQRSISWATWTSFTSIFTYWLHNSARIFGGTAMSFAVIYAIFVSAAWYSNKQWYYLYRYVTDVHADSVAARSSFCHCEGGKELYWKQLKRNRVLRDICPDLRAKITSIGRYSWRMSSTAVGLGACALSSVFFGSAYVPIKKFDASNVQWVMAVGILCFGMAVNAFESFPKLQPFAMLGGVLWALGNVTAVPIMNILGLGMGMLIWGATNCVCGWAVGRFGLFGVKATIPALPLLNYLGLSMVIVGGVFFSQIRPSVSIPSSVEHVIADERSSPVRGDSDEDSPLLNSTIPIPIDRRTKRLMFVANDNLSQSVTFPIISMVPGVCAAMWSVFYFKEITGHRNLRILSIAICTTLTGAVLVGIS